MFNARSMAGALAACLLAAGSAQAATFNSQTGFGTGDTFSTCKSATTTAAFATGTVIAAGDYDAVCVGAFTVDIDTAAQTITLTGFEHGNYEEGFLEITGISEVTITSLSTLSFAGLFDPDFYGAPSLYGAIPTPQLSFTSNSIKILFSAFGGNPFQFTYDGDGGKAVFQYNSTAAVPEPGAWALMILGFASAGVALRRRRFALA